MSPCLQDWGHTHTHAHNTHMRTFNVDDVTQKNDVIAWSLSPVVAVLLSPPWPEWQINEEWKEWEDWDWVCKRERAELLTGKRCLNHFLYPSEPMTGLNSLTLPCHLFATPVLEAMLSYIGLSQLQRGLEDINFWQILTWENLLGIGRLLSFS